MPGKTQRLSRDPERTKRRILTAALHEFALHGFAGARVDTIARRAGTNKRMLYHYFTDKDGLFCAVLRHKISERIQNVQAAAAGKESELVPWFEQNCRDTDWVRLLAWESLQPARGKIMDEAERRRHTLNAIQRIRERQAAGKLISGVGPQFLQLALAALTMFPIAMPQATRLITGQPPDDPRFQRAYIAFLETIARRFRP
jgi:AcrR family transcriptional regulator